MKKSFVVMICAFASANTFAKEYKYYAGNLHGHTIYSDGHLDGGVRAAKTPKLSFEFAKESEHLDFLGISEHNHTQAKMKLENYAKGLSEADEVNSSDLVCLYGMEYGVISNG